MLDVNNNFLALVEIKRSEYYAGQSRLHVLAIPTMAVSRLQSQKEYSDGRKGGEGRHFVTSSQFIE